MRNKEDILRERRTIEAVKKGLMGYDGKIAIIARYMGDLVVGRYGDGSNHDDDEIYDFGQSFMDDHSIEEEGELPYLQEGQKQNAHLFNGYSRGLHLEIRWDGPEIWLNWKGEIVYNEMGGILMAYCPGEWEEHVEKLIVHARRRQKDHYHDASNFNEIEGQRRKLDFLDEMKKRWGL